MAPRYTQSVMDYVCCILILILARVIYGSPSLLLKMINIASFSLFLYDKYQGSNGGYRIAESVLFISSAFGGWVGGVCAMLILRHKTSKTSFIVIMAAISLANITVVAKWRNLS